MIHYSVLMEHNEESLQDLAHMQYDLFCQSNRIGRSVLSIAALIVGVLNYSKWWGILLIFYGSYIGSSKYAAANHTARKLAKQLKAANMPFPSSNYVFRDQEMEIITLPERKTFGTLKYAQVSRMGENADRCIAVETVVRWLLNAAHIDKLIVGEHMKMHLLHFLLFAAVGNQRKTIAILGKCAG